MLSNKLPRDALLRIYKSFVRSHLDYGDDKPNNESFASRLEWVQYKACLAITGAIQGTSRERLYKELGLESLSDRRWVPKLTFFYKIVKGTCPQYLSNYLKGYNNSVYNTVLFENWKKCHDIWKKGPDCVCLYNCSVICTVTLCYVFHQTHSEFWRIQHSVFSGICWHIKSYSALLTHIQAYWDIIKAHSSLFKYIQHPV